MRVDSLDLERDDGGAPRGRGEGANTGQRRERREGTIEQRGLVGDDALGPEGREVLEGGAEAADARHIGRAGLELVGQLAVAHPRLGHRQYHVAAPLPGRHRLEQRLASVEHADARRAEGLVPREGVEVLVVVFVTAASVQDRDALPRLLREAKEKSSRLAAVLVAGAYVGKIVDQASSETGLRVDVVKRSDGAKGFVVLPKRWVVERSLGG